MTKRLLFLLALTTMMTGTAQKAPAATAVYTLNVTANVAASCTLTANALAFSTLNTTAATTATGSVTVNCTPGDALTIALNAGTHATSGQRRMSNGSNFVTYNIFQPTAAGTAESSPPVAWGDGGTTNPGTPFTTISTGSNQTFNVYGQVPSGQTLYVGNYTDSVTVTLTY